MVTTVLVVSILMCAGASAGPAAAPAVPWYLDDGLKKIPADLKDDDLKALHAKLAALIPEQEARDSAESLGAKQARLLKEKLVGSKGFDDVWVTTVDETELSYDTDTEQATLAVKFDDAAPADGSAGSGLIHVVAKISTKLSKAQLEAARKKDAPPARLKSLQASIMFGSRSRTLWVRTDEKNRTISAELLVKKNAINELKGRVAAKLVFKPLPLPVRDVDDTALPTADYPVEVQTRNAVMAAELLAVVFYDSKTGNVLALVK